ncbi:MAG TPA: SOS response-associated peptidase [Gemmatimonadaceae bacterium]|nr:SOS response-associated peptidase [Gemmatimonadaceae bacterium]
MCGRATVVNPDGITDKLYGFTKKFVPSDWKPRYNLNPREEIPAVYYDPFLRERVLRTMHWNLIPSKLANRERVREFDSHYSAFNARLETVASAPTFQQSWRSQRCLVVIDGIIEWVGEKGHRIPHLIRRPERTPFAMAGLWSRWHDRKSGDELWSCTVIVKDAGEWYSRFHDRMAVLLGRDSYNEWLDPERKRGQLHLLNSSAQHKDDELEYFPISRRVNNPGYDSADCLEPATASELEQKPEPPSGVEPQLDLGFEL